jgi:hypothetical protein
MRIRHVLELIDSGELDQTLRRRHPGRPAALT